ncbi:MAG: restriction endonuclease [Methylococcales bacterium]
MQRWQQFEELVASIHAILNTSDYDVETDVTIEEASGAKHQIDVLLRPKTGFTGPVLVSCKAWADPVGVEHVREWSDIVQHTGAASGVIVAQTDFTAGAIEAAKNPERRVSLWRPRRLTRDDFGPDENSPNGYIARVQTSVQITWPRFVDGSLELDLICVDGQREEKEQSYRFQASTRKQWYLRDEHDNITENLWDLFIARAQSAEQSGVVEIVLAERRIVVLGGIQFHLRRVRFEIEILKHELMVDVDMLKRAIGYQNVVTGKVSIVPLPQVRHAYLLSEAVTANATGV